MGTGIAAAALLDDELGMTERVVDCSWPAWTKLTAEGAVLAGRAGTSPLRGTWVDTETSACSVVGDSCMSVSVLVSVSRRRVAAGSASLPGEGLLAAEAAAALACVGALRCEVMERTPPGTKTVVFVSGGAVVMCTSVGVLLGGAGEGEGGCSGACVAGACEGVGGACEGVGGGRGACGGARVGGACEGEGGCGWFAGCDRSASGRTRAGCSDAVGDPCGGAAAEAGRPELLVEVAKSSRRRSSANGMPASHSMAGGGAETKRSCMSTARREAGDTGRHTRVLRGVERGSRRIAEDL